MLPCLFGCVHEKVNHLYNVMIVLYDAWAMEKGAIHRDGRFPRVDRSGQGQALSLRVDGWDGLRMDGGTQEGAHDTMIAIFNALVEASIFDGQGR